MPDASALPQLLLQRKLDAAKSQLGQEMPDIASKASMGPVNPLERRLLGPDPGTLAATNPLTGNVGYFPERLKNLSPDDIGDVLAHELTHSRQIKGSPLLSRLYQTFFGKTYPYGQDPNELEALQTEANRAMRQHRDMDLSMPAFSSPTWRTGRDITLPPDKPSN